MSPPKKKSAKSPKPSKKKVKPAKPTPSTKEDLDDVESDERVIEVRKRFSRSEERKKVFDKLSADMEKRLKEERKRPRPVLSKVERDIHHVEKEWKASQRQLEDLKLQSRIRRAEIARAEEEFRYLIHKDIDLEKPKELDAARVESAKKKLEARVARITKDIGKLERKIPALIQEELVQRGRLEELRVERESIKSGFRDLPIERDPRMTSFRRERERIEKEHSGLKGEVDDTVLKVRKEWEKKRARQASKSPRKKAGS